MKPDPIQVLKACRPFVKERDAWDGKGTVGYLVRQIDACLALPQSEEPAEPASADRVRVMEAALDYYADQLCEGWCRENGGQFQDCGGCRARAVLSAAPEQGRVEDKREAVIQAAREWLTERHVKDAGEKTLLLALSDLFPEDFMGRERCRCGLSNSCDECPSKAEVDASLDEMRAELGRPPRATTDHDGGANP